ncbi:MAG TPA: glutamate racemase [Steroidobacteraceae bacterium]|nr:glutamate racemase [Steroidobacteraceae bacterium]
MARSDAPIGVFDSGVGGLTVLRALSDALPAQDFIYLGDTARLPYGTKSADTVSRYSLQCAQALLERGIGSLVVACNTASASALGSLGARYPHLPVIGVIEPGAKAAVEASRSQHIAVIATEGTINGGAYQTEIRRRNPAARILPRACSMFVALAEEGWTSGPVAEVVARRYLDPLFAGDDPPDTLVLGCTHFPILAAAIRAVLPADVRIVDSAATTAQTMAMQMAPPPDGSPGALSARGRITWLATDDAARFARVGGRFFGAELNAAAVEIIDL